MQQVQQRVRKQIHVLQDKIIRNNNLCSII
jgi:hypothetical protein